MDIAAPPFRFCIVTAKVHTEDRLSCQFLRASVSLVSSQRRLRSLTPKSLELPSHSSFLLSLDKTGIPLPCSPVQKVHGCLSLRF